MPGQVQHLRLITEDQAERMSADVFAQELRYAYETGLLDGRAGQEDKIANNSQYAPMLAKAYELGWCAGVPMKEGATT